MHAWHSCPKLRSLIGAHQSYRIDKEFGKVHQTYPFFQNCTVLRMENVPVVGIAWPLYHLWATVVRIPRHNPSAAPSTILSEAEIASGETRELTLRYGTERRDAGGDDGLWQTTAGIYSLLLYKPQSTDDQEIDELPRRPKIVSHYLLGWPCWYSSFIASSSLDARSELTPSKSVKIMIKLTLYIISLWVGRKEALKLSLTPIQQYFSSWKIMGGSESTTQQPSSLIRYVVAWIRGPLNPQMTRWPLSEVL